jgi:hypothetical protein
MSRINVKVPVARVITSLENRLAVMDKEAKEFEAAQAKHEAEVLKWEKSVIAVAKKLTPSQVSTNTHWRTDESTITLCYTLGKDAALPTYPEAPTRPDHTGKWDTTRTEIENAIRLLRLTDDLHVNASTFKNISKYL